jgi:hypothetical protein
VSYKWAKCAVCAIAVTAALERYASAVLRLPEKIASAIRWMAVLGVLAFADDEFIFTG